MSLVAWRVLGPNKAQRNDTHSVKQTETRTLDIKQGLQNSRKIQSNFIFWAFFEWFGSKTLCIYYQCQNNIIMKLS